MPKKGKSGRIGKMTEEERILFLEQQRLAEEEMRKNKEDMLAQFLKNKLAKEEKASKFNLNKLNHQWRNIMREAKSKELKKDLEILSQTFERVVDRKESVIKALGKDLLEAEEQYSMALRSHLQNVDSLIDVQRQRIVKLHAEFLAEQAILIGEFDTEREFFMSQHQREMRELQDIGYAMEQNFSEHEAYARAEFQSLRDEIKTKNLEEKQALRVALEAVVEDLWRQFTNALKNYQESTEDRKKAFEELKSKDDRSSAEIESKMRKIQRISEKIAQIKGKMANGARESEDKNRVLKEEREMMLVHFNDLKGQMNKLHENERERLKRLAILSNTPLKELKKKYNKGEQLLRLTEMCRRLETEEEKVLPFYASSLTKEEQEDVAAAEAEPPSEPLAKVMYEYSSLENFWKRYNKVLLDQMAMEKEKSILQQQNQQLRTHLKQYLDGISVNDEILCKANPLFVVNQCSNVPLNVPVSEQRVRRIPTQNVIEAAHVRNINAL